jgi:hypothetical protein
MGVDITFFVETNRHGTWECEAQFFLPRNTALFGHMSTDGVRNYDSADIAQEGLPGDVSPKVLWAWGTSREDAGVPKGFDAKYFSPHHNKMIVAWRRFGYFGEAHVNTQELAQVFRDFLRRNFHDGVELPREYHDAFKYMEYVEKSGVKARAVYWFDN